tara:strand:- start:64 stop:501 length:438 start_codon:yes stop_codon:yes gene_type:complete
MLDIKFFLNEAATVRDKYREHIFRDAKDVFDKPFKKYSKEYGEAKRANSFKRQMTSFANSTAPVLTGDLLRDYGLIGPPTNTGFKIGFASRGAVVEQLNNMGRVLTSPKQAIPESLAKYLEMRGDIYIKKSLGPNTTTRHKIGKK